MQDQGRGGRDAPDFVRRQEGLMAGFRLLGSAMGHAKTQQITCDYPTFVINRRVAASRSELPRHH